MASYTDNAEALPSFGLRFSNELDNKKNRICSPLSAETLLALVALGSAKNTRAELLAALNIPDDDAIRFKFTTLTNTLDLNSDTDPLSFITSKFKSSNNRDVILKIANKIYVKQGEALKPDLKNDAVDVFKSSLEQIDFKNNTAAANTINNWVSHAHEIQKKEFIAGYLLDSKIIKVNNVTQVSNQTNDIIKDIVSPDMLDEDTALVLVNAIYFHGLWEIPFSVYNTRCRDFYVNNTTKHSLDMMSLEGRDFNYKHCPELKAKILQMFFEGGNASMVMVLPDEIEGLSDVMQRLTAGYNLMEDIKHLEKTELKVVIPKFKVETEIDLKELLCKMGIQSMFDRLKSDINMLTCNDRLYVSQAIQKAYIVVDEEGTEATVATEFIGKRKKKARLWVTASFSIDLVCRRFPWAGETFIADRPYLYLLTARKIPIFYGIFHGN